MKKEEFIKLFIEELEIQNEDINLDTELKSIEEWDSMAAMVILALAKTHFNVLLTNADIKEFKTVYSIINKIGLDKFE
ncbi:MAG: acyl carrier protein [Bacteroidales bacterium]